METSGLGKAGSGLHSKTGRHNHRLLRMRAKLRVLSNIGLIVGQCVLLFVSRDVGLVILLCSSTLSAPFFIHTKMWDVLILMSFMFVVNLIGLFVK